MYFAAKRPTRSIKNDLSKVNSWETLTTDSLDSRLCRRGSSTLPGAAAKLTLDVTTATRTVRIRL